MNKVNKLAECKIKQKEKIIKIFIISGIILPILIITPFAFFQNNGRQFRTRKISINLILYFFINKFIIYSIFIFFNFLIHHLRLIYNLFFKFITLEMLTIAFGIPISFLIFGGCVAIKRISGKFYNFISPFMVILCWFFVILPFGIIIPFFISIVDNNSPDFKKLFRFTIGLTAILILIAVTIFAIFANIIFNVNFILSFQLI